MQNLHLLNEFRNRSFKTIQLFGWLGDDKCGCFYVPSCIDKAALLVIASATEQWDHVSVSRKNRCPNWPEMDQIKRLFFRPEEIAVQFHVAQKDHINCHPYTLHLWRSWRQKYEMPPPEFVGPVKQEKGKENEL